MLGVEVSDVLVEVRHCETQNGHLRPSRPRLAPARPKFGTDTSANRCVFQKKFAVGVRANGAPLRERERSPQTATSKVSTGAFKSLYQARPRSLYQARPRTVAFSRKTPRQGFGLMVRCCDREKCVYDESEPVQPKRFVIALCDYRGTSLIRNIIPPRTIIGPWAWSYCRVLRGRYFF